jgi:hypothetical protein
MGELENLLQGPLEADNVLAHIDRLADVVQNDIAAECQLFGQSENTWRNNIAAMRAFAQSRGSLFKIFVENSNRYDFPVVRIPIVDSVSPSFVVNTGDVEVELRGSLISSATRFFFNGVEALETRALFSFRVFALLPLSEKLDGPVTITAINPETGESAEYEGFLEVGLPVPEVEELFPNSGAPAGGEKVRIRGNYFLPDAQVFFGETPATEVVLVGDAGTELEVVTPPGRGITDVSVVNQHPRELPATVKLPFTYLGTPFIRGDANIDRIIDISDAVSILSHLFLGTGDLPCIAAADCNSSGEVDLSDAVYGLSFLFQGGPAPPPPHPECGYDPEPEGLSCDTGPACPVVP